MLVECVRRVHYITPCSSGQIRFFLFLGSPFKYKRPIMYTIQSKEIYPKSYIYKCTLSNFNIFLSFTIYSNKKKANILETDIQKKKTRFLLDTKKVLFLYREWKNKNGSI